MNEPLNEAIEFKQYTATRVRSKQMDKRWKRKKSEKKKNTILNEKFVKGIGKRLEKYWMKKLFSVFFLHKSVAC